jgi:tRNA(fMet)-specific endonuclease VapC
VSYLLDTNACIALINGAPALVRSRFQKAADRGAQIHVSSVVAFELWYGVAKSARPALNTQRLETFLSGPVIVLPFEEEDSRVAGSIRAGLEVSGKPIGAYDVLIAGQALARQLTLVTANVSEFSRVKGLSWQDWAKP